ncbi:hypothetical protein Sru01_36740 [Sphaerisporangium rufum]|uniref:Uncharacterized protein n=1 Tax=Sphaerisporangium rufum TaxID=1381558 RepID=A0A919R2X1_9ACTN|nr:hypothetical protein [Sphaerisporangium rufum]GII78692.1 hypothetical protein Sru01_36740 [Sphaerisporangium rufum]
MTTTPPAGDPALAVRDGAAGRPAGPRHRAPRGLRSVARSPWPPAVLVAALAVAVLRHYGTPIRDLAAFAGYLAGCVAVPGTLLVRALHPGRRTRLEEVAFGLAVGYAIEVLAYLAARAAGAPLLVLGWPAATYAAFLLIPRLRRHWRGTRPQRAPRWWAWFLALVACYVLASSAAEFFRTAPLRWPAAGTMHFDLPYALGMLGELRHHLPPQLPIVAGEPLYYHWFAFAHLAAASWITGVEPMVLMFRLAALPLVGVFVVLLAALGRRITGSFGGAALCVTATFAMALPSLYANANGLLIWTGVQQPPWRGPTTTFAMMLFVPFVLVLLDLLDGRRTGRATWALLVLLIVVIMGAKAVYLPLALAGLAAVAAAQAARRRPPWRALAAFALAAACLCYAQFVLLGGARLGLFVQPLAAARKTWAALAGVPEPEVTTAALLACAVLFLLGWAAGWCGSLWLLRGTPGTPFTAFTAGTGVVAVGAALLLGSTTTLNQGYFLICAAPLLSVLAVHGFLVLARRQGLGAKACCGALAAGVVVAVAVRAACGVRVPLPPGTPWRALLLPYAVVAAVVALAAAGLWAARRRPRPWALLVALVVGVGPAGAWPARAMLMVRPDGRAGLENDQRVAPADVPRGLAAAARWLRDHSAPGDVLATNVHCRWGHELPCDTRQYWLAALAERRVLVEGWAFTPVNHARWRPGEILQLRPFWDPARLAANDAAFTAPSPAAVARLRDGYGVRWLVADERRLAPGTPPAGVTGPLFRAGDIAVYRLPAAPAR